MFAAMSPATLHAEIVRMNVNFFEAFIEFPARTFLYRKKSMFFERINLLNHRNPSSWRRTAPPWGAW